MRDQPLPMQLDEFAHGIDMVGMLDLSLVKLQRAKTARSLRSILARTSSAVMLPGSGTHLVNTLGLAVSFPSKQSSSLAAINSVLPTCSAMSNAS